MIAIFLGMYKTRPAQSLDAVLCPSYPSNEVHATTSSVNNWSKPPLSPCGIRHWCSHEGGATKDAAIQDGATKDVQWCTLHDLGRATSFGSHSSQSAASSSPRLFIHHHAESRQPQRTAIELSTDEISFASQRPSCLSAAKRPLRKMPKSERLTKDQ